MAKELTKLLLTDHLFVFLPRLSSDSHGGEIVTNASNLVLSGAMLKFIIQNMLNKRCPNQKY